MKFLRLLLRVLAAAAVLVLVLGLVGLIPAVQTSLAQAALNQQPGVEASLGTLTAGFGRLDLGDSRVTWNGARLDVPSLQATGPILSCLLSRRAVVRSLSAKGWTLDLSQAKGELLQAKDAAGARRAVLLLLGSLSTWKLPVSGSYDGLELEGDVLLPSQGTAAPTRVHVSLNGGGLSERTPGSFVVDLSASGLGSTVHSASLHGNLELAPSERSRPGHVKLSADVVLAGPTMPGDLSFSVEASAGRLDRNETYDLAVRRVARTVAEVHAVVSPVRGVEGTWSASLAQSDVTPFMSASFMPADTASGSGRFTWNPDGGPVHATGRLKSKAGNLGALWPTLQSLNGAGVDAEFDLSAEGRTWHVDALALSVEIPGGASRVRVLQPFTFDALAGSVTVADPLRDFLEVSVHAFPIQLLGLGGGRLSFTSGRADASFLVRPKEGGFVLQMRSPVTASEVSVAYGGATALTGVGFLGPVSAEVSPGGWHASVGPATVTVAGRSAASIQWTGAGDTAKGPSGSSSGHVDADLAALGAPTLVTRLAPFGSHLRADFTTATTDTLVLDATLALSGGASGGTLGSVLHASIDEDGDFTFKAPLKVTALGRSSEVTAEGDVTFDHTGTVLDIGVSSEAADAQHLLLLCAPLVGTTPGGPFWGSLRGQVAFSFKQIAVGGDSYEGVGGNLRLTDDTLRLDRGRVWLLNHNLGKVDATLIYAPAKASRYTVEGKGSVDDVDAVAVFGAAKKGELPPVEGRLAFDTVFSASGNSVAELWEKGAATVHMKSPSGIFRLLKTSVAEAIPEAQTPVADTLGTVGSSFGVIFGLKKGFPQSGKNNVSKEADAVINFTYAISEIGYDQLAATLTCRADGTVRVESFALDCPEAKLEGSGDLAPAPGTALGRRPMKLDVGLSLSGDSVKLLAQTGLLGETKDAAGFSPFKQRLLFTGCLLEPDCTQWHDLLVQAATQKPPKKG